jgi:beta-xylosidase
MAYPRIFLLAGLACCPLAAQTTGDNGSHDPSRMIESGGKVYIYSTGGGMKSSRDGLAWTTGPAPTWNRSHLAGNEGIWAPDIFQMGGKFYLYGSMWSSPTKSSALVLLTSPTVDPAAPGYGWTDQGVVVAGPSGVTHSCIDPAPLLDQEGNPWVVWGGGYPFPDAATSIWLTRLDKTTGLPLASDSAYRPPHQPGYSLKKGHKEGPYIHFHAGYYYLWWQTGGCCSGTSSTYTMHVARSATITGPYTGDRVFYASQRDLGINGPGHMGIFKCGQEERFTYHYYPTARSVIGVNRLTWGGDGWPIAGPQVTTPLQLPCSPTGAGPGRPAPEAKLRIRRGSRGYEVFLPGAGPVSLEILDPAARVRRRLPASGGWIRIPAGMLAPGVNIVRAGQGGTETTALIQYGGSLQP